jgi:hypothetical protein
MYDMAPLSARRSLCFVLPRVLAGALVVSAAGGCTRGEPGDSQPDQQSAALEVEIVSGADRLDEAAKTEAETGIGDVLSSYVVNGFLGDYPRDDFVRAFDSFTSGAARHAAQDIDLLTASRFSDATEVEATKLQARISCLVDGKVVVAATAKVSFGFTATGAGDDSQRFSLEGRLMLFRQSGEWIVFGYDVVPRGGEL